MENEERLLPLGSIVYLNGGVRKHIIIARGLQVNINGEKYYFDYGAANYPEGLMGDRAIYFQHEDISKVIFEGYTDEDDEVMLKNIKEGISQMTIKKADVKALSAQMQQETV